jgi:hypothetical protein
MRTVTGRGCLYLCEEKFGYGSYGGGEAHFTPFVEDCRSYPRAKPSISHRHDAAFDPWRS